MQNQPGTLSTLKVILKSHEEQFKKTRHIMEKRGKSHVKKVSRVFHKIALEDIDYVRSKLEKDHLHDHIKDEEAPIITEVVDPFEE